MRSCQLQITKATVSASNRLSLRPCGLSFFPPGITGTSNRNGRKGTLVDLYIRALGKSIRTDMPTYQNGKPRWFLRDRTWIRPLLNHYNLGPGDRLNILRLSENTYEITSVPKTVTFIDLFAGIGGTRLAFEAAGAKCVFSSEWDRFACTTYKANFGEQPHGDVTKIDERTIPEHDILVAGFPCQPFSIAGVSKKNALGRAHGFKDETQGTLFFDIARILKAKRPLAFLLENVRNLKSHDQGRTFAVITHHLEALGYRIQIKVIDGAMVVPQHRERIYIVGTRPALAFEFPTDTNLRESRQAATLQDIIDPDAPPQYTLTAHLWSYLKNYKEKHRSAGNGFGFGLVGPADITRTLSARYYKDGSEILYHPSGETLLQERPQRTRPRRLTPRECARLMGFPDSFEIPVSDTQAYRQFGNSVVVPVVAAIARGLVECLRANALAAPQSLMDYEQ